MARGRPYPAIDRSSPGQNAPVLIRLRRSARPKYALLCGWVRSSVQRGSRTVHNVTRHSSKHICERSRAVASTTCQHHESLRTESLARLVAAPGTLLSILYPPSHSPTTPTPTPTRYTPELNSPGPTLLPYSVFPPSACHCPALSTTSPPSPVSRAGNPSSFQVAAGEVH